MVIGEDLGTVEAGFSDRMRAAGMFSYRVLYFERDWQSGFRAPEDYPERALITPSTHDLPTLAGFWAGRDLEWRGELDLYPDPATRRAAEVDRVSERAQLVEALVRAGLLLPGSSLASVPLETVFEAVCRWLGAAPSALMTLQLEDVLLELEQANLPGTTDQHPNWQRKLSCTLDELEQHPRLDLIARIMRACGRGRRQ